MEKSYSDFAKELGVSKQKLNYYVNDENTITVHISNLRKKIEANKREPRYIQTVRGIGYKFCEEQKVSDEETEK